MRPDDQRNLVPFAEGLRVSLNELGSTTARIGLLLLTFRGICPQKPIQQAAVNVGLCQALQSLPRSADAFEVTVQVHRSLLVRQSNRHSAM
eukprot:CAMPEP_0204016510 /NCGR_PEP_ID=MMETSP0360-20130528/26790_1 /ASSEMBLY_ACC=CAM_ASM_000342 /TAXON_ID=268821 /ORGANISM="Scrippsiella Hangoei, Strain SHTV-5" /LENGTH=90 /DNA_ID=CAMNT_0050959521 /DNA_START=147 /DNA_END=419 /DNA_ORIENTATION=+